MAKALTEDWTGEDVAIAEIEHRLNELRALATEAGEAPYQRTSVMTHCAWVPEEWVEAAQEVLAGLAERHPSRTIILIPDPDAGRDAIDGHVSLQCFPLEGEGTAVCSEVVELRLRGSRAKAPGSIVQPLLISDLPAFLRWRGQPPFGAPEFEQLVDVVDRLIVDSSEWDDLPFAYGKLAKVFDRVAASDIAWRRTLEWRLELAGLWPKIAEARELRVRARYAEALLLAGWLRSRLDVDLRLVHEEADELEAVAVDGEEVAKPKGERPTPADLLSAELDRFGADRIFAEAVRHAADLPR
ncbi:MAG TPA: glucose-6-phosphate dehydrogenase assembly protein OpcA [Gaiellaceae bacterium]